MDFERMTTIQARSRCRHCINLCSRVLVGNVPKRNADGDCYGHWETFGDLDRSSLAGCDLCALLRQRLLFGFLKAQTWPEEVNEFVVRQSRPFSSLQSDYFELEQTTHSINVKCNTGRWWIDEHIHCAVGSGAVLAQTEAEIEVEWQGVSSLKKRYPHQGSLSNQLKEKRSVDQQDWPGETQYRLIRRWIDECTQQHSCSRSNVDLPTADGTESSPCPEADLPLLPTRIIEIGRVASDLRLVVSDGRRAQYMTLSYCWGQGPHEYVTTVSNYKERLSLLRTETLPKTIRESIIVARALQIQYLWVDALCILQPTAANPDLSDWEIEASRMAAVYENSLCTIAASGAEHKNEGCFTARPSSEISVCTCYASDESSGKKLIIEQEDPGWHHSVGYAPLGRRGWVLQEELLSPRTIYWTRYGLYWECRQLRASEHDVAGRSLNGSGPFGWAAKKEKAMRQITHKRPTDLSWLRIIERYSTLGLTHVADKLVAISGLARVMQRHTRDDYVAGLWKSNLAQGLAWRASGDRHGPKGPYEEYVAPSWSWASVAGQVWWPSAGDLGDVGRHVWDAEIADAEVELRSSDPLGQINGGRVRVAGYMGTTFVGRRVSSELGQFTASDHLISHPTTGSSADKQECAYAVVPAPPVGHDPGAFGSLYFDQTPKPPSLEGRLECLQLSTWHSDYTQSAQTIHGLILRPTNRVTYEYVRIGYFELPVNTTFLSGKRRTIDIV